MTGRELVAARQQMGLTQDALASRLGVHVDTVSRWESGTRKISMMAAKLIYAEMAISHINDVLTSRDPFLGATASLAAALSILEKAYAAKKPPNKMVGSDRIFEQMLKDYNKALATARAALRGEP